MEGHKAGQGDGILNIEERRKYRISGGALHRLTKVGLSGEVTSEQGPEVRKPARLTPRGRAFWAEGIAS